MTPLACVEVGGSGCQTVVFEASRWRLLEGPHRPDDTDLAIAVPGLIRAGRVALASNLGWRDVDPAEQLGLAGPAAIVLNDAEAAALGEAALRAEAGSPHDLVLIGLGTGVGGAVVRAGEVVGANLFGHSPGFSERTCRCGRVGCLETVVSGWALPETLEVDHLRLAAAALARAIDEEPLAEPELVVVAGGMASANPALVDELRAALPGRRVEASAAPAGAKSASAWGLRYAVERAKVA